MKYTKIDDQIYINIPDLKAEIKQQFDELNQQEPSLERNDALLAVQIVWTFFNTVLDISEKSTNE